MKESVLIVGSSIPPLQFDGGALASDPAVKAALLSNFFEGKQSRDVFGCPAPCHRRPKLCTLAFWSVRSDGYSLNLILMVELIR